MEKTRTRDKLSDALPIELLAIYSLRHLSRLPCLLLLLGAFACVPIPKKPTTGNLEKLKKI